MLRFLGLVGLTRVTTNVCDFQRPAANDINPDGSNKTFVKYYQGVSKAASSQSWKPVAIASGDPSGWTMFGSQINS